MSSFELNQYVAKLQKRNLIAGVVSLLLIVFAMVFLISDDKPKKQAKATIKSLKKIPPAIRKPADLPPFKPIWMSAKKVGPMLIIPRNSPYPTPFNTANTQSIVANYEGNLKATNS